MLLHTHTSYSILKQLWRAIIYNNLPKALIFIISFSSATQKCNQQGLTVNLNFSVWLPTFSIMLSRYHLSLTSYSHTLPPFWPFSLLSVSFVLFVYVFITTWVPKLEWFSVHLSKFYKDQTKRLYGFLNYMNPHLKLFCKECWFCWLNKNAFGRKPILEQQNLRAQSSKCGKLFLINPIVF